jgi:murein DD-endopeptidase MepM/ murein hydrolase activator NlpD
LSPTQQQYQTLNFKKTLSDWLTNRYQLIVRSEENFSEKVTFSFSHARLISLSVVLLSILVVCSMVLTTTILAQWLNPAHTEQENKKRLIQLATEVDRLEEQTIQQKNFITLLQNIIAGKEPLDAKITTVEKEHNDKIATPYSPEKLSTADALLRCEFEDSKSSSPSAYNAPAKNLPELVLFPPIHGIITTAFEQKKEHYGVDIVAKPKEPIKCVADGTVIFSSWTVETGWVVVIQHNTDLVSIYKHDATFLKKVGNFVEAGEVVAIIGSAGKLSARTHLHFELWYEGQALNPEHFITF